MKYLIITLVMLGLAGCGKDRFKGPVGPAGPKGDTGSAGTNGQDGKDGGSGPQGAPGAAGQDASSVTIVKLCPGTTVYPTTFVEIAFCVSGRLYGTYSANGGFSTELPPGAYSSNAIGSSCSFVIESDCVVHQ